MKAFEQIRRQQADNEHALEQLKITESQNADALVKIAA